MNRRSVLNTLRRIPDRIILAVAARDLQLAENASCLCGWVIREHLAEIKNIGASRVRMPIDPFWKTTQPANVACAEAFGGAKDSWDKIYFGVCNSVDLPIIESAYVQRLDEAVFGRDA